MFGVWRLLLAIEVVVYHLAEVPIIGRYAVFSFFVLSGFLMTAVLQGTYGYSLRGFRSYLENRALRLFPSYWFAIAVSLVLIALLGGQAARAYNEALAVPASAREWVQNLSLVFFDFYPRNQMPRLSPATWALTIELCFYALIGLGASRTRATTLVWLGLSVGYILGARITGHSGEIFYGAIPAASLPFAVGAATWHYREALQRLLVRLRLSPVLLIGGRWLFWLGIVAVHGLVGRDWVYMLGNWLNIPISALIVCALFHAPRDAAQRQTDKLWGDLSYPTYLLHWQMGLLASTLLYGRAVRGASVESWISLALALPMTLALGSVCARLIDPAVERVRTRIRDRATCAVGHSERAVALHAASDPP